MATKGNDSIGVAVYTDIDWIGRSLRIAGSIFEQARCVPGVVKDAFSAGLDFAFEMLNMRRVEAEVLMSNRAGQLLEVNHLGFRVEGVRRQAVYKCGMYIDSIILGMLREEWEQQNRVRSYNGSCNCTFDSTEAAEFITRSRAKLGPAIDNWHDVGVLDIGDGLRSTPETQQSQKGSRPNIWGDGHIPAGLDNTGPS
jgi:hypothetical protein